MNFSQIKIKVMTQFKENNPERLKEFIHKFRLLIDEFHPNIYLLDDVFEGVEKIEETIKKKLYEKEIDW